MKKNSDKTTTIELLVAEKWMIRQHPQIVGQLSGCCQGRTGFRRFRSRVNKFPQGGEPVYEAELTVTWLQLLTRPKISTSLLSAALGSYDGKWFVEMA